MIRAVETGRMGRDTPRLYALYSVVFRCRMHTKTACKPYCRKGFQFCIQCIQRISTPPLFGFSLLLEHEYMNTRPDGMMCFRRDPRSSEAPRNAPVGGSLAGWGNGAVLVPHSRLRPDYSPPVHGGRIGADVRRIRRLYSAALVNTRRRHRRSGRERRKRPETGATRPGCIQCIQLYSAPICIQIRPLGPTPVRVFNFVFSVFSVFRPPCFLLFSSF